MTKSPLRPPCKFKECLMIDFQCRFTTFTELFTHMFPCHRLWSHSSVKLSFIVIKFGHAQNGLIISSQLLLPMWVSVEIVFGMIYFLYPCVYIYILKHMTHSIPISAVYMWLQYKRTNRGYKSVHWNCGKGRYCVGIASERQFRGWAAPILKVCTDISFLRTKIPTHRLIQVNHLNEIVSGVPNATSQET